MEVAVLESMSANIISFFQVIIELGALRREFNSREQGPQQPKLTLQQIGRLRYEKYGIPNPFANVFRIFPTVKQSISPSSGTSWLTGPGEAEFMATITGFSTVKIPSQPSFLKTTPEISNKAPSEDLRTGCQWMVVQEGTTSIPILGKLLPQN